MESRYKSIKHIGEGAFSSVILALNIETNEKVAIKKMKKRRWKDTAAQAEISALQKLHHENIIRLLDVFREDYRSFLVFECMDCDLNELVVSRNGRRLPDTVVLDITYQVLNGLDFIHRNDLFHRDIKPENVLIRRHVTPSGPGGSSAIVVEAKIADFGLVHDMDFSRPLTDYISTRWYRAPEVLLACANYSTPIDVWAVGTIVAELSTLRPLFPGNNQIDQLRRIFDVLGTPKVSAPVAGSGEDDGSDSNGSWYEGAVHARKLGIAFVPSNRKPLDTVIPETSSAIIQLVDYILVLNPNDRPSAKDALGLVSRMLDHALGEPQQAQEAESVGSAAGRTGNNDSSGDVQMVPRASLSRGSHMSSEDKQAVVPVVKDSKDTKDLGKSSMMVRPNIPLGVPPPPQMNRNGTSPIFGPVNMQSSTLQRLATTPTAIAAAASAIAPLASASTKADDVDDTDDDEVVDKTLNDHTFASFEAKQQQQRVAMDGRISFTPRDKFDQQLINKQIQKHSPLRESSSPEPTREVSADSLVVATSRPSVEINIVKGMHREPMRDPRGDLSALLPAAVVPMSSGSSSDSGSIISIASDNSGDNMSESDQQSVAAFSVSDLPSPISGSDPHVSSTNGLRLYSDTPSVIGNVPMTNIVVDTRSKPTMRSIAEDASINQSRRSVDSCSSSDTTTCRSARKTQIFTNDQSTVVNVKNLISAQAKAISNVSQLKDEGFVYVDKHASNETKGMSSFVPMTSSSVSVSTTGMASPAISQKTVDSSIVAGDAGSIKSPSKLLGFRQKSGGGLGSNPLIRRALSMKKNKKKPHQQQQYLDESPSPPPAVVPELNLLNTGQSPSSSSQEPVIKRSKSALDIGDNVAATAGTGLGLLGANDEINLDDIGRTIGVVVDPVSLATSSAKPKKKDEWIANTQFLRQRLGSTKDIDDGKSNNRASVASMVARKRRSSVGDVHQMLSVRDSNMLMAPAVPVVHNTGRRQPVPSGLFANTPALVQKNGRQSRRSTFTENNAAKVAATHEASVGDYLGMRVAMDQVMRSSSAQDDSVLVDNIDSGSSKDVMAGLDSFAPVTFDANTLFRNQQQLLMDPSASGTPSPSSPFYSTKGGALSPANYMSTFSDVRSKFNHTSRNKHHGTAATAAASEQPSGHRFLSKMKHAFGGGRHGSGAGGRRRSASNSEKDGKPAASRIVDAQPPRLDFDLGSSLLTPDSSLHRNDNSAAEQAKNESGVSHAMPVTPAAAAAAAAAVQVANDSAYYLIDYINSTDNEGKADVSGSYIPAVSQANNRDSSSSLTPAARRIVNKSTRLRQTQYDYKFGSQIFECFDKDLLLLKTDLFRGLEDNLEVSSMTEWMKSTSDTIGSITVKHPTAKMSSSSSKKKQVDVTKATAYTAAALNRIVAHNNKNRSNNAPAAATGNSSQLSRQLMA
ncbi:hypothetical protein IWW45_001397 [Coemansia sp. RSA 485]|nr:hypothetical protein IWW45_001397 [Coemansia sp. RSA 485]